MIKNKTLLILVIIFIVFSTNAVAEELPNIDAKAYVLMDTTTGRILEGKNEDEKRAMASTTKIMTAIIALEKGDLASIVEVSKKAASIRGSSFHLSRGEKIPLETMLYGLLLCSGNDAAVAIAEHIGESQENFVQMMNQKAIEIGALNTNFKNPHGLDEPNHFTTTKDLAIIARYALDIPKFREIVGSREKLITRGDKTGTIYNTNKLLWSFENATGIKTGYTGKAGRCLVASAYKNGFELISVVLGSPSNFNSSYKLLNFGFTKYQLRQIIKKDNIVKSIPVKKGILKEAPLIIEKDIILPIVDDESLSIKYLLPEEIKAPVEKNQKIGELAVYINSIHVYSVPLISLETVKQKSFMDNIFLIIKQWLSI
ncbi:MAG: D-alanyl-D-alanine carboxypeptidase family protein [Tepidanaerobacteraceae bacterium]